MLLKVHLTFTFRMRKWHLHSRVSGSRWVIPPSWLSGSWRSFWYSSSVYSCHLFLISSASVRSIPFLSFIVPIFAWNVPLVYLIFLKRALIFHILLFSSIYLHWSLKAQTNPFVHEEPGPHRDWARHAFEFLSVSCRGMGHHWPATGAGTLGAADLGHTACA